ncbi:hypothetical protein Leryth_021140 [Lithospermum erythrorhizon]|nr:hypothetical protein Leryth_021140 [Lithospermum erythrorhizon]
MAIDYAHGLEPPRVIGQTLILPSFKDDNEEDECRQIFSHVPDPPVPREINYDEIVSSQSFMSLSPEFLDLHLPRLYQFDSSFSKHTIVLVFGWCTFPGSGLIAFALMRPGKDEYHIRIP